MMEGPMRAMLFVGCALLLVPVGSFLQGQDLDDARWWSYASIAKATYDGSVYPPTYRLYGPQSELRVLFEFTNRDAERQVMVGPAFFDNLSVGIDTEDNRKIPVAGRWVTLEHRAFKGAAQSITQNETVVLSSGDRILGDYVVRTTSGVLTGGTYVLRIDSARSEATLEFGDQSQIGPVVKWTERLFSIEAVEGPGASQQYLRLEAQEAHRRGDFATAVKQWQQLRNVADDVGVAAGMGMAYFGQRDFRNAARELEKALPAYLGHPSAIPQMLAQSYLALNEEPRAIEVLRFALPDDRLQAELERLKNGLRNRSTPVP